MPSPKELKAPTLSPREEQLVFFATSGLTEPEMADRMGLSVATVKSYWSHLRKKVGAGNRTEAVSKCVHILSGPDASNPDSTDGLWWHVMCRNAPWIVIILDRSAKIDFISRFPIRGAADKLLGRSIIDLASSNFANELTLKLQELARGASHLDCTTSLKISPSKVLSLSGRLSRIDEMGILKGYMFFVETFETLPLCLRSSQF